MCICYFNFYIATQSEDDPMMAQVQLVAQKKLTMLREKEKELQQQVSEKEVGERERGKEREREIEREKGRGGGRERKRKREGGERGKEGGICIN